MGEPVARLGAGTWMDGTQSTPSIESRDEVCVQQCTLDIHRRGMSLPRMVSVLLFLLRVWFHAVSCGFMRFHVYFMYIPMLYIMKARKGEQMRANGGGGATPG